MERRGLVHVERKGKPVAVERQLGGGAQSGLGTGPVPHVPGETGALQWHPVPDQTSPAPRYTDITRSVARSPEKDTCHFLGIPAKSQGDLRGPT